MTHTFSIRARSGLLAIHGSVTMSLRKHAHAIVVAIFHGCKNVHFQINFFTIFLSFAQNIDFGYTLEPPQSGGSNEYPQSML